MNDFNMDHFRCFARNHRWGTCGTCPRDSMRNVYPEFCPYTQRYDHQMSAESLSHHYMNHKIPEPVAAVSKADYVTIARQIATTAHQGQTRWGGEAFVTHPEAVAAKVKHLGPEYEAAALLHSVLEDCPDWTSIDLANAGIPVPVTKAVLDLSHLNALGQSYLDYLLKLARNPVAKAVKLADLEHNLETSDPTYATHKGKGGKTMRDTWQLVKYILEHLT